MLPCPDDLHPEDRAVALPLREDGSLDLHAWTSFLALMRTVARCLGADPDAGVNLRRDPLYGWHLDVGPSHLLIASVPAVGARLVVREAGAEPDTPSGRRRALVRIWRALRSTTAVAEGYQGAMRSS
ncbi:MAG: hypothetical protein RLZZ383_2718 [Pseudomonadota bacterium]|jgi:hypothetical protein